ncbi:MAG TPA: DUF202 domain-containing protein [Desulfobulbus sp.]|nr:DUF202 domain-containing protein [Desulfobulbus sp.]
MDRKTGGSADNCPDRTRLALDRTVLANERTFAAWIRSGLACLVSGLGVARFMRDTWPLWSIRVIAAILILFSAAAFLLADWRYHHLHLRLIHVDVDMVPPALVRLLSLILAACSLIASLVVWGVVG